MPAITAADTAAHLLSTVELSARLGVDERLGLSVAEAAARARRFGPNLIARERGPGWVRRSLAQVCRGSRCS